MVYRSALPLALILLSPGCRKDTAPPDPPAAPRPSIDPIPDGFFTLTPRLTVQGVEPAVEFYAKVFGAEVLSSVREPSGATVHAEIRIGDSVVMLEREDAAQGTQAPATLGGTPITLVLHLDEVDTVYANAVGAGATALTPIEEQFWGDRYGELVDPFGHRWALASHVEDLTPEQLNDRAAIVTKPAGKRSRRQPPQWRSIAGTPASDPTPEGYHTLTIALTTHDAAAAVAFYKAAFGAEERVLPTSDGKIIHGELAVGDSIVMLEDELPGREGTSASALGGSPVAVYMYVEDVDAAFAQATEAGAEAVMPVGKKFWGDRQGMVRDAAGVVWGVASRVEAVTVEQMEARLKVRGRG